MYCTDDMVTGYLPADLPADVDTSAERAQYITRAGALVDGLVGRRFGVTDAGKKFPGVTDDPPTPEPICEVTALLAASHDSGSCGVCEFQRRGGRSAVA